MKRSESFQTRIALVENDIRHLERNRKLQAKEYKRRLADLNGEAGKLHQMQAEYIPREVFDRTVHSLVSKVETLTKFVYIGIGGLVVLEIVFKLLVK